MTPWDMVVTPRGVRFMGRMFPCAIGRGLIRTDTREGDGATPTGTHDIVGMYYRADRMAAPTSFAVPIGPNDLWSDDVNDTAYNSAVRAPYIYSHETLRRADPLYDLILVTDYNYDPAIAGRGSAIFVHQWRRPHYPTEGCVAFSRADLRWIARRIEIGTRLIVR